MKLLAIARGFNGVLVAVQLAALWVVPTPSARAEPAAASAPAAAAPIARTEPAAASALATAAAPAARGALVFKRSCATCHGTSADGNSELAKLMRDKPANLRASRLSPEARERIVRAGGAAVGRSASMPAWQGELSEQQIQDVLAYVATLGQGMVSQQ